MRHPSRSLIALIDSRTNTSARPPLLSLLLPFSPHLHPSTFPPCAAILVPIAVTSSSRAWPKAVKCPILNLFAYAHPPLLARRRACADDSPSVRIPYIHLTFTVTRPTSRTLHPRLSRQQPQRPQRPCRRRRTPSPPTPPPIPPSQLPPSPHTPSLK
ncbi:hypothetical protein B0H16DRAFT_1546159 [Mycena metata]|uniref:Uncharacterized protein n=1 Tax=Mycena metata TaxID=1033252 RepID=A0AAD7IXQ1_9AGAR|nr:hypothetical protein B0H16DRAFT_1546159 [Mycena metata]